MLSTVLIVVAVCGALLGGAAWGLWGSLSPRIKGFLIALAGGALIEAVILELVQPSLEESGLWVSMIALATGAIVFSAIDYLIDEVWGQAGGFGLFAALTLDGIPENLALGVAMIGAEPVQVVALAGAIFLSNLPEAAGGAEEMRESGMQRGKIFLLWSAAALALGLSTFAGYLLMDTASPHVLAAVRCFAAGAVVASLATEVFPKAYREDHHLAGVATVLGLMCAFLLAELG